MQNISKKKLAAICCAAVFAGLMLLYLAVFLFALLSEHMGSAAVVILVLVYCAIICAVIFGVIAALRQRLRELDSGEEEESKKY